MISERRDVVAERATGESHHSGLAFNAARTLSNRWLWLRFYSKGDTFNNPSVSPLQPDHRVLDVDERSSKSAIKVTVFTSTTQRRKQLLLWRF